MILYFIRGNTFFIINDSLFKDANSGTPIKYSSKVFTVPHLDCFIFGIGTPEFIKTYCDHILNIVSDNINYVKQESERFSAVKEKLNISTELLRMEDFIALLKSIK